MSRSRPRYKQISDTSARGGPKIKMDTPGRKKFFSRNALQKPPHEQTSGARVTERAITPVKASRFELVPPVTEKKGRKKKEKNRKTKKRQERGTEKKKENFLQSPWMNRFALFRELRFETRFKPHERIARCSDYISRIVCYICLPCIIRLYSRPLEKRDRGKNPPSKRKKKKRKRKRKIRRNCKRITRKKERNKETSSPTTTIKRSRGYYRVRVHRARFQPPLGLWKITRQATTSI